MEDSKNGKKILAVYGCSDPRGFWEDAINYARENFPDYEICPLFDLGGIKNIVSTPGKINKHPTIKKVIELGIIDHLVLAHENCRAYEETIAELDFNEELAFQEGELNAFFFALKQVQPSSKVYLGFQKINEDKTKVVDVIPITPK